MEFIIGLLFIGVKCYEGQRSVTFLYWHQTFKLEMLLNNIIKKKLLEHAIVGHRSLIGRLYRETDTVLKKLLMLIKYW